MDPLSGAIGVGAGLASLATSAFNIHEQRQNRRTEIALSNTAHQREVTDLRKAGLNPILSARLGGAGTPSFQAPSASDAGVAATSAYQGASSAKASQSQSAVADKQLGLIDAQSNQANSAAKLSDAQAADSNATRQIRLLNLQQDLLQKINDVKSSALDPTQKQQQIDLLKKQIDQIGITIQGMKLDLSEKKVKKGLYDAAIPVVNDISNSAKSVYQGVKDAGKAVKHWWEGPWGVPDEKRW